MNALPPPERQALADATPASPAGEVALVDLVDFKWLMTAEGLAINLDRLRGDAAYARQVFSAADASGNTTLRRISAELQQRLNPAAR